MTADLMVSRVLSVAIKITKQIHPVRQRSVRAYSANASVEAIDRLRVAPDEAVAMEGLGVRLWVSVVKLYACHILPASVTNKIHRISLE